MIYARITTPTHIERFLFFPRKAIAGAIVAAVFGFLISIPVLKLQGDYLAIVTLAFGQIIKSLINNTFLGYDASGLVKFSWH